MSLPDSTIQKFDYLNTTKSLIRQSIINAGQTIAEDATFRSYVTELKKIKVGGLGLININMLYSNGTSIFYQREMTEGNYTMLKYVTNITKAVGLFRGVKNMYKGPEFDASQVTDFTRCFYDSDLVSYKTLDTSACTNFEYMFANCKSLTGNVYLDMSSMTEFKANSLFSSCDKLQGIELYTPNLTSGTPNTSYMFPYGTTSTKKALETFIFSPGSKWLAGGHINISNNQISHENLINTLNSLPAVDGATTINVKGNPGASLLSESEMAGCIGRGWTVVKA